MSRSPGDDGDRLSWLRTRLLVITAVAAVAGVVGAVENASPYDVRVDDGDGGGIPSGSLALVEQARPVPGDVAAYHRAEDDLGAALVTSVRDLGADRYYVLDLEAADGSPSMVADDRVLGRLTGQTPHLGALWTLPATTHATIHVVLVGAYLGVGAIRARRYRFDSLTRLLGRVLRR